MGLSSPSTRRTKLELLCKRFLCPPWFNRLDRKRRLAHDEDGEKRNGDLCERFERLAINDELSASVLLLQ